MFMPNNDFDNWSGNSFTFPESTNSKKTKKDRYDNPLGFTEQPYGINREAEDILRQSRETDRVIGETAKQLRRAEPIPEVAPVKALPVPGFPADPQTEGNGNDTSRHGNRFQYKTKAYNTGDINEMEKRASDYEESLKIDSGNEGYTLPPVQPSTKSESYPDENRKLQENAANEGFTIRNSEEYRQAQIESEQNIKSMTEFFGKFFHGNERENRFANGLPAEGEGHYSILGNYRNLKNKTDNLTQEDWEKSISNLYKSPVGQATMDIYHSGAAGGYELGNEAITAVDLMNDAKKNGFMFLPAPYTLFENHLNGMNYTRDVTGYSGYKIKKYFRDKLREHLDARSEDNTNASLNNPGYLSVKGAGTFIREFPHALAGAAMASRVKGGTAAVILSGTEGAMAAVTERIDKEMERLIAKPEEEMLQNPDYVRIRKKISDPEEARYIMAKEYSRKGILGDIFKGALKGILGGKITDITRNGTEGLIFRLFQDVWGGKSADLIIDKAEDILPKKKQENGK